MANFIVDGIYFEPVFWSEEVNAEDELEAADIALELVTQMAPPQSVDFEIFNARMNI